MSCGEGGTKVLNRPECMKALLVPCSVLRQSEGEGREGRTFATELCKSI